MAKYAAYVVIVGTQPGVYDSWTEAGPRVDRVPSALHKGYRMRWEAEEAFARAEAEGRTRAVRVDGWPAPALAPTVASAQARPPVPAPAAHVHKVCQDSVPTPPATPPHTSQSLSYTGSPAPSSHSQSGASTGITGKTMYQPDEPAPRSVPQSSHSDKHQSSRSDRPKTAPRISRSQSECATTSSEHTSSSPPTGVTIHGSDVSSVHPHAHISSGSEHSSRKHSKTASARHAHAQKVSRNQSERAPGAPRIPTRSLAESTAGSEPPSSSPLTNVTYIEPDLSSSRSWSPPLYAHISEVSSRARPSVARTSTSSARTSATSSSRSKPLSRAHSDRLLEIQRGLAEREADLRSLASSVSSSPTTNVTHYEPALFTPPTPNSPSSPAYPNSDVSSATSGLARMSVHASTSRAAPLGRSRTEPTLGSPPPPSSLSSHSRSSPRVARTQSERACSSFASASTSSEPRAGTSSARFGATGGTQYKWSGASEFGSPAPSSASRAGRSSKIVRSLSDASVQTTAPASPIRPSACHPIAETYAPLLVDESVQTTRPSTPTGEGYSVYQPSASRHDTPPPDTPDRSAWASPSTWPSSPPNSASQRPRAAVSKPDASAQAQPWAFAPNSLGLSYVARSSRIMYEDEADVDPRSPLHAGGAVPSV